MPLIESIGPFSFLDLKGAVQVPRQEVELLKRPGVDGVGGKLTGVRGKPFELRSVCDAQSIYDAEAAYQNYVSLSGTNPVAIVHHGVFLAEFGVLFLVLDVERVIVRQNLFCMGGLFPPSLGWVEARWHLCAVLIAQEEGEEGEGGDE